MAGITRGRVNEETMSKPSLPPSKQLAYAIGQLGWSTLINIIGLELVYIYLPPSNAGLPQLITDATFLVVLNAITLIAAFGRLWDAVTDPLIASWSDRSKHPQGRRIPFLFWGALPAAIACWAMFVAPVREVSSANLWWLLAMQVVFYLFLTVYVTPYFALLPEMGRNANERLNLSTWISITYALGIIVAAQTPLLAGLLGPALGITDKLTSLQYAIGLLAIIAALCMYMPVIFIKEKDYCESTPIDVPLFEALKTTFANVNFRFYVVADFAYFTALAIINTGLLYYITVLLGQHEALVAGLLAITVIVSFLFYPAVNILAKKVGKKILVSLAFFGMCLIFFGVFFLGRLPLDNVTQAYILVICYALPLAFLGVLPNAVLSDIAEHDAQQTGRRQEGMFFAARTLMQKFGQTFGILIFAGLTTFGKDPGNDLGIRLSGIAGFVLCFAAGVIFLRYNEARLLAEMKDGSVGASQ